MRSVTRTTSLKATVLGLFLAAAMASPTLAATYRPDGIIGNQSGTRYYGEDIYNTTGVDQTSTGRYWPTATIGYTVSLQITVQNDGAHRDRFRISAPGPKVSGGWKVAYPWVLGCQDDCPITAAVRAGTYLTPVLKPHEYWYMEARMTLVTFDGFGGKVQRLVTISSVGNPSKKDAVKFRLKAYKGGCGC